MRLKFLIVFFLTKSILINGQVSIDLTKYVNPLVGTDSKKRIIKWEYLSGHCYALGNEFLDTPNQQNGRWLVLPICCYQN